MVGEIRKQQAKCLPQKESPTSTVFLTGSFLARIRLSEASTMVICIAPSSFFSTITAPLAPKGNDDGIRIAFCKIFCNSVSFNIKMSTNLKNAWLGLQDCIPLVRAKMRNGARAVTITDAITITNNLIFLTHILFLRSHHTSIGLKVVCNEYDRTTTSE